MLKYYPAVPGSVEPLRELTGSPGKKLAERADHDLSAVCEIPENRRESEQAYQKFRK